ncbi:MAG: O-antigen ligase family protein [Caldisericia bacterium]
MKFKKILNKNVLILAISFINSSFIYFILLIDKIFNYPEIYFALYLTAGVYKNDPRLDFLPKYFDLTIFFELFVFLSILYILLKNKKITFSFDSIKILISYIIFIFLIIFSTIYSIGPIYGINKLLRFLFITTPAFFLPSFILKDIKSFKRFIFIFIILSILISFDIIKSGFSPYELSFKTALGTNYLAVGRISGIGLISTLYLLFIDKNLIKKSLLLIIVCLILLNIFLSGGRGPILSLISTFLIIIFYLLINTHVRKDKLSKKLSFIIIKYFFIIFILCFSLIIILQKYIITIFYRLSLLWQMKGYSIEVRLSLFNAAIKSIFNFPNFITGLGLGGFNFYYTRYDISRGIYPHNIFLEILSELGIIGFIIFTYILIKSFSNILNKIKTSESKNEFYLNFIILTYLLFMLINASTSGDLNDNRLFFLFLGISQVYRKYYIQNKE